MFGIISKAQLFNDEISEIKQAKIPEAFKYVGKD